MTKRASTWAACLVVLFSVFFSRQALCAERSPEAFVQEFYAWYFTTENAGEEPLSADFDDAIYKYMRKETVDGFRAAAKVARGYDKAYATQNAINAEIWTTAKVSVEKAADMGNNVFVVPVTFTLGPETSGREAGKTWQYHVIVYVRQDDDAMRIIKISDLYPYS